MYLPGVQGAARSSVSSGQRPQTTEGPHGHHQTHPARVSHPGVPSRPQSHAAHHIPAPKHLGDRMTYRFCRPDRRAHQTGVQSHAGCLRPAMRPSGPRFAHLPHSLLAGSSTRGPAPIGRGPHRPAPCLRGSAQSHPKRWPDPAHHREVLAWLQTCAMWPSPVPVPAHRSAQPARCSTTGSRLAARSRRRETAHQSFAGRSGQSGWADPQRSFRGGPAPDQMPRHK
mmetsp:Transcript_23143/g.39486  ORF Transcript_23143/g.39486 Transcript_23143/m.39486 type:complete len:226 (+) Transcript_23143:44-721(+)